jgi:enamine deaminase RidA (YjgF/YER057c/UK114 family)
VIIRDVCANERESVSVEDRLRGLGVELPRPPRVLGAFAPAKLAGSLLFVSGAYGTQPDEGGEADTLPISGRLGVDLSVAEGQASARLVAVNLLAMARAVLGTLDRVQSVVRLVGYVNAAPGFVEAPRVLDGASCLLIDLFGTERGSHARMALYQPGLPGDAPLTAELLLEVGERNSPSHQAEVVMNTPDTSRTLRIAPRAGTLAIHADPQLKADYRVDWGGAEPTVCESGGEIEVGYTVGARLRALSPRPGSLTVALNPDVSWSIELAGGVSGLRADLRDLQVSAIAISGGASDAVLDLPRPRDELSLRVEGGVSDALVRRPADIAAAVEIDGGASQLNLDGTEFGAIGGVVRQRTPQETNRDGDLVIRVLGGASQLIIDAHDRVHR